MHSLLPFLYLFSAWTKGAWAADPTMPFMEYLDEKHMVCLMWGFDNLKGNITFKLEVNTTGWVGFGFSPNGGMKGADMVIGGVGPDGSYFTDRHALGRFEPLVIQSCDKEDFLITAQPIKLIYAYGLTDEIKYHRDNRGTKEVNLLEYMPRTTSTNLNFLSATMDNIEPVIEQIDIVHRMLLYRCPSFVTEEDDRPCYMGDMGDTCFGVVAAWAVGGGVFELPENVGIPIGGVDSDTIYRLEIHYNNPRKEAGRTDSSGLRLHYTAQLRQYNAGIMTTGVSPLTSLAYNIPPKAPEFHTYGVCNTTLFSEHLNPVPELQFFAVMLHTHLAGRKIRVGHYRNGTQTGFLALDEDYDFGLQQTVNLGHITTVKQGDEIAVECTYDTSDRTNVTIMGLGSTDEMCLAFLYYYPAINITSCVSHPNTGMSEKSTTSDQNTIAEQESLMKNLPQIQYAFDDKHNYSVNARGTVRDMMETPVTCETSNAASGLSTSCKMKPAGIILVLLYIAIM
ncbi:DBH-like monooxygenase protein 2 like [Dissostichus eleginoides]|uniref:DBH-like monooxygenase protein 2 like n=1 Tax=Dissostichus eleginoides TaxID=100907 RepID=A0AAD9F632_DISEL|nr:DBH-like monooxygenase protein 2 like [Dissostichus eleginoides]